MVTFDRIKRFYAYFSILLQDTPVLLLALAVKIQGKDPAAAGRNPAFFL